MCVAHVDMYQNQKLNVRMIMELFQKNSGTMRRKQMSSDYVNFQEKLGMTDHQVLNEILMMRKFEKAVAEILGDKKIEEIYMQLTRELVMEDLVQNHGVTPEEASFVCSMIESEIVGRNGHKFFVQSHDWE